MAHHSNSMSDSKNDNRGVSQMIFIIVGLVIIVSGLWFLYQDNAPYHPDVTGSEGEIYLPADS